ncbi:MAG: GGDEF domain-containing protein, partial [Nitriliruptoraceae bacterium]
ELIGPGRSSQTLVYLLRVHAFLVVLLALAAAIATLRESLVRTLARAEVLEELASTDQLTGLANRRAARELLEHETQVSDRYGRPLSVIMLDIDRFKSINDTHGHGAGDDVLRAVASVLHEHAREADLVARWGGEEFLIVAPQTAATQARPLAERCRRALADRRPRGLAVTATLGVAQYEPGETVEALLDRADRLLYRAKRAGRDQVHSERASSTGGDGTRR